MHLRVLGIDPGLSGAFAVLDATDSSPASVVACHTMPLTPTLQNKDQVDVVELERLLLKYDPYDMVALEQVHSRPGEGPVGAFTFGRVLGRIESAVLLHGWPLCEPSPQAWKKLVFAGSGIPLKPDKASQKAAAIALVRSLFPALDLTKSPRSRQAHDGKAEAVCLALYALAHVRRLSALDLAIADTTAKGDTSR